MAKKTTTTRSTTTRSTTTRAAATAPRTRRRSTTEPAAAPVDIATVAGTEPKPTAEEIAEAAYQRYLSRGGQDGSDFDDWIEAERELRSRRSR